MSERVVQLGACGCRDGACQHRGGPRLMTALDPSLTQGRASQPQLEWVLPGAATATNGESWAIELVDAVAVEHRDFVLLFARRPGDDGRLYYSVWVVDRDAPLHGPSWYVLSLADGPSESTLSADRLSSGAGSIVVLASRVKMTPLADAPQPWAEVGGCRIISDDRHVYVFRRSSNGERRHLRFALVEPSVNALEHDGEPYLAPAP